MTRPSSTVACRVGLLSLLLAMTAVQRDLAWADGSCPETAHEVSCLYRLIKKAAVPAVRRQIENDERNATREKGGKPVEEVVKRLRALAARVSEANPTLEDAQAVWLEGTWQIGATTALGKFRPPDDLPDLPDRNDTLTARAGALCDKENACATFGLEPQKLADGPGRAKLPDLIGVPADTPYLLAYIDGKAAYGIVPLPNGHLLALTTACQTGTSQCGFVRQEWINASATAKLIRR